MSVPRRSFGRISMLGCLLGAASLVHGQTTERDSITWKADLTEAVVTGERQAVKAHNAMRVIRKMDLKDAAYASSQTLQDALRLQNGIRMSQDPALGAALTMNGLGGQNVKIMIDGVPLAGRLGDDIDLAQIRLDNIASIEIVEGPMAVEYGTNSLAGTIHLISKKGQGTGTSAEGSVRYESVGDYTQSAGLTWRGEGHTTTVQMSHHAFDGWSPSDPGVDWIQDFVADSGRVSDWNPKRQGQFSLTSRWTTKHWNLTPKVTVLGERIHNRGLPRSPYGTTAFDDVYHTTRWLPSFHAKRFGADGVQWDIVASWQRYERRKEAVVTDLTTLSQTPQSDAQQDTTRVLASMTRGTRHLALPGRWGGRLGWDAQHERYVSGRVEEGRQDMLDAAAFGILSYSGRNAEGQVGLRQAWNSSFGSPLLPSANVLLKRGEHRVRASYARGFRAPTLKELHFRFVDINHLLFGNENLDAEASHYGEVSWTWAGQGWRLQGRGFVNSVEDQITLVDQLDGTFRYDNVEYFQAHGLGLQVGFNQPKWSVQSGFLVTGQRQGISTLVLPSKSLYTPEATFSGTWVASEHWRVNANAKIHGTRPRYVAEDSGGIEVAETEAYTLLDAQITYLRGPWSLNVGWNNLLDVTALNATTASGPHAGGTGWVAWGRSVALTLKYNLQRPSGS